MARQDSPVFRLYLLRHARAGWAEAGKTDFERTLDERGFAEAEIVAGETADRGYRPDLVISSTAARCRQTAEAFLRAHGEDLDLFYSDELYSGPADVYAQIAFASRSQASLMLVGHNPMIEEFFHRLVGQAAAEMAAPFGYPTAGLAVLDFDSRPEGEEMPAARLSGFLTPLSRD